MNINKEKTRNWKQNQTWYVLKVKKVTRILQTCSKLTPVFQSPSHQKLPYEYPKISCF